MNTVNSVIFLVICAQTINGKIKPSKTTSCFANSNHKIYEKYLHLAGCLKVTRLLTESNTNRDFSVHDCVYGFNKVTKRPFLKTRWIKDKILNKVKYKVLDLEKRFDMVDINTGEKWSEHQKRQSFLYNIISFDIDTVQIIIGRNPHVFYQYFSTANVEKIHERARQLHIIFFTSTKLNIEDAAGLLVYLWNNYKILNVLAQNPSSDIHKDKILIYKPFEKTPRGYGQVQIHHVSNVIKNPHLIENNVVNLNKYPVKISLFERYPTAIEKLPYNLRDRKIYDKVQETSKYYGTDGVMISELANELNFSVDLSMISKLDYYGMVTKNGTAIGSLGQVVRGEVDLQGNSRFYTDYGIKTIEFSMMFEFDKICVLVPKSGEIPKWVKIYKIFWNPFILNVLCVFVLCSLINAVVQRKVQKSVSDAFLEIYSIALGLSQYSVIRSNSSLPRRILLTSCLIFFIVISTLLTAGMFKLFSTTSFLPEINTLKELDKSGLIIKTSLDVFQNCSNKLHQRLARKVDKRWLNVSALDLAIRTKLYAGFERKQDAELKIQTNFTSSDGTPQLHIVPECPSSIFMGYIVPLGSPYLPIMNVIVHRFVEGGLTLKWYSDFRNSFVIQARMRRAEQSRQEFGPFNLEDLQSAFYILVLGHILSLFLFSMELLWRKCHSIRGNPL